MSTLLFVSGSLRVGSVNTAVVRTARRIAESDRRVHRTSELRLTDFPFYNEDVDHSGAPRSVRAARAAVRAADAVVISTPAYNGAPPGVLKNALDWLSRPAGRSVLQQKVVATVSASPGRRGGLDSQEQLRTILARCGCVLVDHQPLLAIDDAISRCTPHDEFTDPAILAQIDDLVAATLAVITPTSILGALV